MCGLTSIDWPKLFKQAYNCLKPGGWFEMQEVIFQRRSDDNSIPKDSQFRLWEEEWHRGIEAIGYSLCDLATLTSQMKDAGFAKVEHIEYKLPIGAWPKDERLKAAGIFWKQYLMDGMSGMSSVLFQDKLGYTSERLEALLLGCTEELKLKKVHTYMSMFVIYAQRL